MSQNQNISPLTAQHLTSINRALDQIATAQQQADMAARAGIDVSAQVAMLANTQKQLLQIKQVYFPGQ